MCLAINPQRFGGLSLPKVKGYFMKWLIPRSLAPPNEGRLLLTTIFSLRLKRPENADPEDIIIEDTPQLIIKSVC